MGKMMRIVVKVGTSTLAHGTGRLNIRRVELLCKTLADLQNAGHQVVLVSSGRHRHGRGQAAFAKPSRGHRHQAGGGRRRSVRTDVHL